MIQLEEVHIEELRGIRRLTLPMNRKSFAIHGPNGSGKSGVVDAIEFGLTGDISRLSGKGTGGLSVRAHGPHVDARDYPDKALVRLKMHLPGLGKTVTLTRRVKAPNEAQLEPDEESIRDVLKEVAAHPEITLTRRQIIKLILTEAGSRSKDIQALLRLDAIDGTRSSLKTAANRTKKDHTAAQAACRNAADALRRHLDISKLGVDEVLSAVNPHRETLGLQKLLDLTAETSLSDGVEEGAVEQPAVNKETAQRDLQALKDGIEAPLKEDEHRLGELRVGLRLLNDEPALLTALQRRSFVRSGLEYVTEDLCPLCDTEWDADHLRKHLGEKLQKSEEAEAIESSLMQAAAELQRQVETLRELLKGASKVSRELELESVSEVFTQRLDDLLEFKTSLSTVEGALSVSERVGQDWRAISKPLQDAIADLDGALQALPDRSAASDAAVYLAIAQERLKAYRQCRREEARHEKASIDARAVYKAYCDSSEELLRDLYEDVQEIFARWYREINKGDESKFSAKLSPSEGKLDLSVDFYERGLFHPGAYHSEGHQDGMGLCLYLALMRQLLGCDFRLAVLDDVVMSVDKQHRKEVCALLSREFPETQFVITTHDEAWLHQMKSAKLVDRNSAVQFRGWTIEDGPRVQAAREVWEEIEDELENDRVSVAAGILRRYLEFASGEVCAAIGATVRLRLDASYDLGDLLPNAVSRFGELLKRAITAADSWGDQGAVDTLRDMKEEFEVRKRRSNVEQWAVNRAVHYNEWTEFERADFAPVVLAFRDLLGSFRCGKCGAFLEAQPPAGAEKLSCQCSALAFTLVRK